MIERTKEGEIQAAAPRLISVNVQECSPLLWIAHVPRFYFEEALFNEAFVTWTIMLAWLWGTYADMSDHGLVMSCREDDKLFEVVTQQNRTLHAMAFVKGRLVEVLQKVTACCRASLIRLNPTSSPTSTVSSHS